MPSMLKPEKFVFPFVLKEVLKMAIFPVSGGF